MIKNIFLNCFDLNTVLENKDNINYMILIALNKKLIVQKKNWEKDKFKIFKGKFLKCFEFIIGSGKPKKKIYAEFL